MSAALYGTADAVPAGVVERDLPVVRDGRPVPALLWTPADASGTRPLVLLAHGGGQHKRTPGIVALATRLVLDEGFACLAVDGPGHGDRVSPEQRERALEQARAREQARRQASVDGVPPHRFAPDAATQPYPAFLLDGVQDWTAALDAAQALPEVGAGPVGWWGVSMGTSLGIPFVAGEPRVTCAVLGLASTADRPGLAQYLEWARSITVPLLLLSQRDDGGHPVEQALALYDLFGSTEKTMHLNPGPHVGVPAFERDSSCRFFGRHLG